MELLLALQCTTSVLDSEPILGAEEQIKCVFDDNEHPQHMFVFMKK